VRTNLILFTVNKYKKIYFTIAINNIHMRYFKQAFLMFIFFCFAQQSFSQSKTITGKITDAKGIALEGVSVQVVSTKKGTLTAKDGSFSLIIFPTDVVHLSYIGYQSKEIEIGNQTNITVALESGNNDLGEIILIGSRRNGRVKTETAVPVDVINLNQATMPTAKMDLTSILNTAVPSFNYNKQSGSDGADHIDLATLRGLGPDQTLVLVNGKRRHQTAFVAVFGTRGRGASGTDLNAIPQGAIDKIEVLRDGASAQYGSDAIAGVINLILKKDINKFNMNIGWSGYDDDKYNSYYGRNLGQYPYAKKIDGNTVALNMNYGFALGKKGGFMNITASGNIADKTYRQVNDTSNLTTNNNALILNTVRRANGDASLVSGGTMINIEIPINSSTFFYAFGGFNFKSSDAFAFSRNFSGKPNRFPTTGAGTLIFDPNIMTKTPDGDIFYNPHIQTNIEDLSLTTGVKGVTKNNWNWDLSSSRGSNKFHFYGDETYNASLGSRQTRFDDGGFLFAQHTVNLNFSKEIKNVASGLNIAFGAEHRNENYKIFAGEEASFTNYNPTKYHTQPNANAPSGYDTLYVAGGSQGFPGYRPSDEVNAKRNILGLYADGELDLTKKWLVGIAARFENYSDFGATTNFKIATRYKVAYNFNIRGSFSTGFRAPSLQQINFSSTFTTVQGGKISEVKIAPNYSAIAKAAGIPNLTQEKSTNFSMGFTWKPIKDLSITLDGYMVQVKDRVVLSGQFDASDATLDLALTNTLNSLNVGLAQFFANAVNTTNTGIDLVIEYNKKWGNHTLKAIVAGNVQNMKIDQINTPTKLNDNEQHRQTFFSDRERKFLLASAPPAKGTVSFEYGYKSWTIGTKYSYFGKIDLYGYGEDGLGINPKVPTDANSAVYVSDRYIYKPKVVVDLFMSHKFNNRATLFFGADNLFNIHPDYGFLQNAKGWAFNTETGGPWDAVQMGSNGRRLFARLVLNL
jgi:iron complex outermembrane receptor protein